MRSLVLVLASLLSSCITVIASPRDDDDRKRDQIFGRFAVAIGARMYVDCASGMMMAGAVYGRIVVPRLQPKPRVESVMRLARLLTTVLLT
jgi:hypothetical protein